MSAEVQAIRGPVDESRGYDIVEPRADVVTEALRAVGYDLETAVADIVDNSISAGSSHISIAMAWDSGGPWIRVADDGCGMTEGQLIEAMRIGSRSPLLERDPRDLGRFGLGLKTASFSQCRQLSVRSCSEGERTNTRCWDLDVVQATGAWTLLNTAPDSLSDRLLGTDHQPHGTVVLWQKLDRVAPNPTHPRAEVRFLSKVADLAEHLAMIFHRYLAGQNRVEIKLNENPIVPWDPFMVTQIATQVLPEESFEASGKEVSVQAYVLPHESKITSDEHHDAAGPRGWNAQQGFYIYRNRRLIVAGGWLGMFQQEEHYKLARIRVDTPNSLDDEWQLDIRKSSAHPPAQARDHLRRVATITRRLAKRVYGYRGAVLARQLANELVPVWRQVQNHGVTSFRLNREHPCFAPLLNGQTSVSRVFNASLALIEETIPINLILSQFSENRASQIAPFAGRETQLRTILDTVVAQLNEGGVAPLQIRDLLLRMEPFCHYPGMIAALIPADF